MPPPDRKRDDRPATERPPQLVPPTSTAILPDPGDPRRIGELLGDWLAIRMSEVDDLVAEACKKVEAIPDQRSLWLIIGELVVRLSAVELEVAELRKAARR